MMKPFALLGLLIMLSPSAVGAQNSIFGTLGIGFPGRVGGVRSIALGGGSDIFDRASVLNPALAASFGPVTVGAVSGTTFRSYTAAGTEASGLQETRFPLIFLGGGFGRSSFSYHVSVATFAERTFDLKTVDTVMAGDLPLPVQDRIIADGGVVDIRAAIGWRRSAKLALGGAVHRFAGSSRFTATRTFDSGGFQPFLERDVVSFAGTSFSAGLVWLPNARLGFGFAAGVSSSLTSETVNPTRLMSPNDGLEAESSSKVAMPVSLAGGVWVAVTPRTRLMTTARWRSWSRAQDGLPGTRTQAFDTWEVGSGLEIVSGPGSGGKFPLRLGVRYAQLPFSPSNEQPSEWNFSVGTGAPFAANRAVIEVALERFQRDGAGARERGWYFTVGFMITPVQ